MAGTKVKYKVKTRDVKRIVENINHKKSIKIKPKNKPKSLKTHVISASKFAIKRELQKQRKKTIKKAKKKLKEMETLESESISNLIGSAQKTQTTSRSLSDTKKVVVIGHRKIKEIKLQKNKSKVKTKLKIKKYQNANSVKVIKIEPKKTKIKGKVKNITFKNLDNTKSRKIKLRDKKYIKLKDEKQISKFNSNANFNKKSIKTKNNIVLKKRKIKNTRTIKLKQNVYNLQKNDINFKKNYINLKSNIVDNSFANNDIYSCKSVKEVIDRKRIRNYERSEKVSKLDTFSESKEVKKKKKEQTYSSNKKNKIDEKSNVTKKINNQKKKKYITNKNSHTKNLKKQSKKTTNKAKKPIKKVANNVTTKVSETISKTVIKISANITKSVGSFLSNPYVLIAIGIIFGIIVLITIFTPMFGILENKPNADTSTLSYLIQELKILDNDANEYLENIADEEEFVCDKVEYIYNSQKDRVSSSSKEFIIYLMLLDDNVITLESVETLKLIHEKSYKVETELINAIDEETSENIDTLNVTLTVYTFDEMLDILGFTDEQKERAYEIKQLPFEKIYQEINFNEAGKGLTKEEIEALVGELPETTLEREEIRAIAFTLVDYTVYDWGGKASGSVERPTGLDCSGFVAWVYDRAGITSALQGGGTTYQWGLSSAISYGELKVGDLGFQHDPATLANQGNNHVGIYIGNGLWIECYSSHGVGVTSGNAFSYYREVNALVN